eukprot:TRINITY_DN2516_c0_g2_i5.p5 TRINITY_DN2516_c0_g2~~TRINITY_DN2516_c0_g2_i5.p5  ORF type:complete len:111 (+),score=30.21 TRINITY_DN2516_c0_g2_i5:1060-1392(+)
MVAENSREEVERIDGSLAAGEILGTIRLPRNLGVLSERLPKPNYSHDAENVTHVGQAKATHELSKQKLADAVIASPPYKVAKDLSVPGRRQGIPSDIRQGARALIPSKIP